MPPFQPPPPDPLYSIVQQVQPPPDIAQYGYERQEQQARDLASYLGTVATSNAMGWSGQQK
jgi:hypothetical protein